MIDDMEIRLQKDEWNYLIEKYPHVAFNFKSFDGKFQGPYTGHKILLQCEPQIMMPEQWDINYIRQYDGVITYNSKFYNAHKHECNMKLVHGCLACNAYYNLDSFRSYEERLPGACILNKTYVTYASGDIVYLRKEIAQNIAPHIPVDIWSHVPWGGSQYKGKVESPIHHSHINHLKKINEYRFSICFESTYHEYWSWDFITERLFNCFKAKTVPIYIGCYNIEQHVPSNLFIDFRKFQGNYSKLIDYLQNISKSQWIDMTEAAFEWNKTNRIGNIEDLENIICEFEI